MRGAPWKSLGILRRATHKGESGFGKALVELIQKVSTRGPDPLSPKGFECPPWKSLGMCRRVTNKGESGFGKASDRVKAEDHFLFN